MWERERLLPLSQTGADVAEFDPLYQPRPWPEGCGLYLAFRIRCEGLYGVRKNVLVVAQQITPHAPEHSIKNYPRPGDGFCLPVIGRITLGSASGRKLCVAILCSVSG